MKKKYKLKKEEEKVKLETEKEKVKNREIYIYDNIIYEARNSRGKNQILQDQVIISLSGILAGIFIFAYDKIEQKLFLLIFIVISIIIIGFVLMSIFLSIQEHSFDEENAENQIYFPKKYKKNLLESRYKNPERCIFLKANFYNQWSLYLMIILLILIIISCIITYINQ